MASGKRLTVVQIGALSTDGDGMYRVHEPAAALAALAGVEVYNVHYLSRWRDEAALAADVLVVYFTIDIELFRVFHLRRRLGKASFCEINDYFLDVPAWNPVHASWSNPRRQHYLVNLMARSDAVQVSSPRLADHFRIHNGQIGVFPNHIARLPPPRSPRGDAELVVGWGGSAGHLEDIERVAPILVGWLARHPEARLAIMADPYYATLFTGAPPERVRFVRAGALAEYLAFVRTLDVGLAPLLPTEYNRCRSDVKFLEYAAHGAVAVVQRLDPYAATVRDGETGFLFDDDAQLAAVLDRLAASVELRARVAAAAYDYVRRARLLDQHVRERVEFYDLHRRRAPPADQRSAAELARAATVPLASLPGLEQRGPRHWQLEPRSPAERTFLDGLTAMDAPDLARASAAFAEATRLAPDYYQAHYYLGRCLARQGRSGDAERAYQTAARLNPFYSRPLSALADLHGALAADYRRRSENLNPPLP
jgi:glycosyltransferase involved in cell wall biosynthesis